MADEPQDELKEVKDKLEEKATVEEPNPDPTPEPTPDPTPQPEPKEDIDVDKLREEIATETADRIVKGLKGEEASEETLDEYEKFAKETYEREGRQPKYNEAFKFLSQQVKAEIRADQEAQQKEAEEAKKQVQESEGQRKEQFNKYIDNQLKDLYDTGRLPKIQDENDENDEGVVARKELFQTMMDVNKARVAKGDEPIYSLKEIYYEQYKQSPRQPAGADAPVSAGRGGLPTNNDGELSYEKLHKSSFEDIIFGRSK